MSSKMIKTKMGDHEVSWIPHPMFDNIPKSNILPPYEIIDQPYRSINITKELYDSIQLNGHFPDQIFENDEGEEFTLTSVSVKEDFFEKVYSIGLKPSTTSVYPIKNLKRTGPSMRSFYMMSNGGLTVKSPVTYMRIVPPNL